MRLISREDFIAFIFCEIFKSYIRVDIGIYSVWKELTIIHNTETFQNRVYTVLCRLSVKIGQFEEVAKVAECDAVTFRPVSEFRCLSIHFTISVLIWYYNILIGYCSEEVNKYNDPINKHCPKMFTKTECRLYWQFKWYFRWTDFGVKILWEYCFATVKADEFAKAKI